MTSDKLRTRAEEMAQVLRGRAMLDPYGLSESLDKSDDPNTEYIVAQLIATRREGRKAGLEEAKRVADEQEQIYIGQHNRYVGKGLPLTGRDSFNKAVGCAAVSEVIEFKKVSEEQ